MKSIVFIFMFIVSLYASTAPTEKEVLLNAKNVSEKGWETAKKPLKDFVKKDGQKFIAVFLKTAKHPMLLPKKEEQRPKILLSKNDYYYALSYLKYLENKHQTKKALNIYFTMLNGLKEVDKKEYGVLGSIYRVVVEKQIVASLKDSIKKNIYAKNEKKKLKSFLKTHLILNKNLLSKSLEADRVILTNLCITNLQSADFSDKSLKEFNFLFSTKFHKDIYKDICSDYGKKLENHYMKLLKITNKTELKTLKEETNNAKALFYEDLKHKKELKNLKKTPKDFVDAVSGILFYSSYFNAGVLQLDILKSVKENNKLLSSF